MKFLLGTNTTLAGINNGLRYSRAPYGQSPPERSGRECPFYAGGYCFRIQLAILSSATGEMVSSISAYSLGAPVLAVWNR